MQTLHAKCMLCWLNEQDRGCQILHTIAKLKMGRHNLCTALQGLLAFLQLTLHKLT